MVYIGNIATTFTLTSGVYADEQALLAALDGFLVDDIGRWVRLKVVTDSPTDKNIAYYADGTHPALYERFYLRMRATSDNLRVYGMSYFDTATNTDYDAFGGTSNETELPTGTSSGTYWFLGNYDNVHVVIRDVAGNTYHGGFGCWRTYYNRLEDPKPFYVFGQTASGQTFQSADRLESYGPQSWGTSFSVAVSGTARAYRAQHPTEVAYGTPNPRSGYPRLMEPVFYTAAVFPSSEVRGEVPGLYLCGGSPYTHGNLVTISGGEQNPRGVYFIHKHADDIAWALGPVARII